MNARKLMDSMAEFARTSFENYGQLFPMWHLVDGDGQAFVYVTPFNGEKEKDAVDIMIRSMVKKHRAVRLGFMSETWVAIVPKGTSKADARKIIPSEQPDRKEALYMICEDIDGTCLTGYIDIDRGLDDKGILGSYHESSAPNSGRFANFFDRATVH